MPNFLKPPVGSKVNITHPLAKGLVGAWLFNEGSGTLLNNSLDANHGDLSIAGADAATWRVNRAGPNIRINTGNQYAPLGSAARIFRKKAGEVVNNFTIVHCFRSIASPQEGWAFGVRIPSSAATSGIAVQIPNIGGNVSFFVGGIGASNVVYTGSPPTLGNDVWTYTNSFNRGMEIWQNGILLAANNNNPSWVATNEQFVIGDPISDTPATTELNAHPGEHSFFYIYDRVLTPDEIRQIAAQPFQFFQKTYSSIIAAIPEDIITLRGYGGFRLTGQASQDAVVGIGGIKLSGVGRTRFFIKNAISAGNFDRRTAVDVRLPWRSFTAPRRFSRAAIATNYNLIYDNFVISGIANISLTSVRITTGSGIEFLGTSVVSKSIIARGGCKFSGTAELDIYDIIEETLDGEGLKTSGSARVSLNINYTTKNGIEFEGRAKEEFIFFGKGGCRFSGIAIKWPGPSSAVGTGGIGLGGVGRNTVFVIMPILSFGVQFSGRAINTRRGFIYNVRSNIALAMRNDNFVKTDLQESLMPNQIFNKNVTPTLEEIEPRFEEQGEWCYIEDCSDKVLPRIVVNRQGQFVPPKKRGPIVRERQNVSLS